MLGTGGNFYGTTYAGGSGNDGTVFEITPSGTLTTLHSFGGSDGDEPDAGLLMGSDGNFYGTTERGGADGLGTVFRMTTGSTLTTIYSFPRRRRWRISSRQLRAGHRRQSLQYRLRRWRLRRWKPVQDFARNQQLVTRAGGPGLAFETQENHSPTASDFRFGLNCRLSVSNPIGAD